MAYRFQVPMDEPAVYRIIVIGQIDARLASWLGELELSEKQSPQGERISTLTGLLRDQAALIGVLVQLYNRGHCLLGLERVNSDLPTGGNVSIHR